MASEVASGVTNWGAGDTHRGRELSIFAWPSFGFYTMLKCNIKKINEILKNFCCELHTVWIT